MERDQIIAILEGYRDELGGILTRFNKGRDGIHIAPGDDSRFREIVFELRDIFDDEFAGGGRYSQPLIAYYNDSVSNWIGSPSYRGVDCVGGIVGSALLRIQRNPLALKKAASEAHARGDKDPEIIAMFADRLHSVVYQLRERHAERPTLDVADEYDVQDLFHALLSIHFDDIRKEEWAPSYAGASSRMDFLLPEIESVVEIKMTRPSLSTKHLGEQLIVDIAKYKTHPQCRTLYCVVYDPERRIANPRGVEKDLAKDNDGMIVRVMIVPN
jgi:hypothetical protein